MIFTSNYSLFYPPPPWKCVRSTLQLDWPVIARLAYTDIFGVIVLFQIQAQFGIP